MVFTVKIRDHSNRQLQHGIIKYVVRKTKKTLKDVNESLNLTPLCFARKNSIF